MLGGGALSLGRARRHESGRLPSFGGKATERFSGILSVARDRGIGAGAEAWMEDPYFPPAKGKSGARERVRRIARENLPRLLSAPGFKEEPGPATIENLSQLFTPTLVLVGERDDRDNQEIASFLASRLPHAQKKVFLGCGHLVNLEKPEEFYNAVVNFLDAEGFSGAGSLNEPVPHGHSSDRSTTAAYPA